MSKNIIAAIFVGLLFICFCKFYKNTDSNIPVGTYITFDELDEIKELAENRSEDYNEILDKIVSKINDIEEREKEQYEDIKAESFDKEMEKQW